MKLSNLLTLIFLVFIGSAVSAQTIKDFKKDIKGLTKATKMTKTQEDKVTAVYSKIIEDLNKIESLRTSDEEKYREKRRAIYSGSQFTLAQIITTEQQDAYTTYKRKLRADRGKEIKKLQQQKAPKGDLQDAELGVKQF